LPFMERRDINHRITAKCPGVVMLEDESSFSWDNVNSAKRGVHTSPKYESVDYVREEAFHVLVLSQRPPSVPKHLNVALRVFKIPQVEPRVAIMEVSDEEEDSAPVTAAVNHATRRVTGDDSATDIDE
jgi:predicted Fe-Mo cluster-binding NifX family protein